MPASNRTELLAVTEKEYAKLLKTLGGLDADLVVRPGPGDDGSIKDTLAHRAHWLRLFLGWYGDGKAGKAVQTPAPGYKWNQLKEYNAKVREESRSKSWKEVVAELKRAHGDLLKLLNDLDDAELYTTHLYPWTNDWTLGRWAEASGASHYRSANKHIRKIVRDLKDSAA